MGSSNNFPTEKIPRNSPIPGWLRIFIFILPYIFIVGAFQLFENFVFELFTQGNHHIDYTYKLLSEQIFNVAGIFLVLFGLMLWIDREPFLNIGLRIKNYKKDAAVGLLVGFILITFGFVILYICRFVIVKPSDTTNGFLFLSSIFLFFFVALGEEMLMRGYVLRNLMLSFNKYIALGVSSLIFSSMHFMNPDFSAFSFVSIFVAGIMLGASYIFTKNLWFPIGLHFGWNFMQSIVGFNVSGLDSFSFLHITPIGNTLISGGSFGFEGSVVSVFMMMVCIIFIFGYYRRSGGRHF